MKGAECRLIEYMESAKKRFIIPVYQRNYDWRTEHCKQLYNDLVKVVRQGRKSHFFGSLVSVYRPSGRDTEFLVIDGQQRLTTISLLFLAMYHLIQRGVVTPQEPSLGRQIYEDFLVDRYRPEESRMKLKLVKNDRLAFQKLFETPDQHIPTSHLTVNYNYFYDRIQKQELTIDQLFDAICRLEIISITLNDDDNPQLIFESLNSTGLELSEGDKIRNFILMGLPTGLQEQYYEKYWNRIEEATQYDVSAFIRDYLSIQQQAIPSQKRIYATFKEYVEETGVGTEVLLADLLAYAKRYRLLLTGGTGCKELDACIHRLNRLETTVTRPFFLQVLSLFDQPEPSIRLQEVADIFTITENYLFRRTICDLPTNALNKIFLFLHREILRYDGSAQDYVEKFKYALLSKRERARYPEDEEFAAAFAQRQVFLMSGKNKLYILERLENFGTAEDKDVYRHCEDGTYTIEHIMPQHLTPAWQQELGEDYQQIHTTWLHRIANLTLSAYNPKYSNRSFQEKKTMPHGFLESGIRMNTYLARQDRWTQAELEARSAHLQKRALEIWGMPSTSFQPLERQLDVYTLEDDTSLSGRLIARFRYKGSEQPVTSWIEMYEKVLQILHPLDRAVLGRLAAAPEDSSELAPCFSTQGTDLRSPLLIEPGIYAERNTSTDRKTAILRRLFPLYGADPADLVFYLREEQERPDEPLGSRRSRCWEYWAYALPQIQQATGNGLFTNVHPSRGNWINGFFGISGFNICCVANSDSARVELYFGKPDQGQNKAAFDRLLRHRPEIEAALGVTLTWSRGEQTKSSKVFHQLSHVGVEREADWPQIAQFHAQWSRRFYEILVPYVRELG